jgi:MFS family permease
MSSGEIRKRRIVPSLAEIKQATFANREVTIIIISSIIGQFFIELINSYLFIFYKAEFNTPDYIFPLALSVFNISSLSISLPSGLLSDKMKARKPFLVIGQCCAAIGIFLTAFATHPMLLIITFIFTGLSNPIFMNALQAYFSQVGGDSAGLIFGAYMAYSYLAGSLSPIISGAIAQFYGLRSSFILSFFGTTISVLCLLLLFFEKKKENFSYCFLS